MEDIYKESLALHEKYKGKLEVRSKFEIKTREDLTLAYTPGVAEVCREIAKDRSNVYKYTIKSNTVAIVTDGSAVLGLGDIGGYAAIPVMEGKAILFKEFAGIDAFPICFEDYHIDFTADVKNIAPVFGAINLEDIAAPKCFQLEEDLQDIGIPVMHDDQHGTSVVVLAGLMNACKVVGKGFEDLKIVINGAGAAGYAITRFLGSFCLGDPEYDRPRDILVCDRKGIIHKNRPDIQSNKYKKILANETNFKGKSGSLSDAFLEADVFIGVSGPNLVTEDMVRTMNEKPMVFALANPTPEIMPDLAKSAGAYVVATGRSDFPNQLNNVLAFPGIFRGALDARAKRITDDMKTAAVYALANYIKDPTEDYILPDILDRNVTKSVAKAVEDAA
jgi:malate dehydrogenase (oxaloacetate-decarboxylating)